MTPMTHDPEVSDSTDEFRLLRHCVRQLLEEIVGSQHHRSFCLDWPSTVELTPHIDIHDLCRWNAFPRDWDKSYLLEMPFRYPFVKSLLVSVQNVEVNHHSGYNQRIALHWARTGFGRPRPLFVCQCGYGARRLFFRCGNLACRTCHKAVYASQKNNQIGRKRLAASKLRLQLGGFPDICEPMPSKPKWRRRRTYQRIRNEIQALEATAKTRRFKKPLSTQLFAYHIG
jgi:hypothetical protein